jgi:hypothetical protein
VRVVLDVAVERDDSFWMVQYSEQTAGRVQRADVLIDTVQRADI